MRKPYGYSHFIHIAKPFFSVKTDFSILRSLCSILNWNYFFSFKNEGLDVDKPGSCSGPVSENLNAAKAPAKVRWTQPNHGSMIRDLNVIEETRWYVWTRCPVGACGRLSSAPPHQQRGVGDDGLFHRNSPSTGGDKERGECAGNETALCGRRS